MKVVTGLLALVFCIVLLLLIRYIRSEEGFADKPVAIYDFGKFFAPFQLEAICPVWDTVYTNFKGAYKTDEKGHQLPEDIVKKATDTAIAITTTTITREELFPESIWEQFTPARQLQ